jgi:predicted XRE-type DNA-binding protein
MITHNQPKREARPATPDEVVKQILAMGQAGIPQKAIASDLGIAQPTVSKLMRRHGLGRYQKKPKPTQ